MRRILPLALLIVSSLACGDEASDACERARECPAACPADCRPSCLELVPSVRTICQGGVCREEEGPPVRRVNEACAQGCERACEADCARLEGVVCGEE